MAKDTFDQNENSWIAKYEATDLLEQIDIDELKVTEVLMPEEKAQLIRILEMAVSPLGRVSGKKLMNFRRSHNHNQKGKLELLVKFLC